MSDTVSDKMRPKIECDMPYLRAIQKIPGDTAAEKFKWIGTLASQYLEEQQAGGDLDQVPQELQPLLQVETAIKQNTPDYEDKIMSALQSEDSMINQRALKARWFFNGTLNKERISPEYFCHILFPTVSLKTRTSIINVLANQLIDKKEHAFAEKLFTAITSAHGIKIALPLLVACRESFVYDTIVEKKLILSYSMVKKIYRVNSNLAARYLELIKPLNFPFTDDPFAIGLKDYTNILVKLVKKHLQSFIKVCIAHNFCLPRITLSNTSTEIFLKEAKDHLLSHPKLFFTMLSIKMISTEDMETVFPKILSDDRDSFSITVALEYLEFYPLKKKFELLSKSYKDKYNAELLDDPINVTPALLRILPTEKRIQLARSKIEEKKDYPIIANKGYETTWICYYSTKDAIPLLMENVKKASSEAMDRADYIGQMIYCCKVNYDNKMLAEIIKYITKQHRNERSMVCEKIMDYFAEIYYDAFILDQQLQSLVFDMLRLFYVKHGVGNKKIIASLAHYRITNNQPLRDLMEILIGLNKREVRTHFSILEQYPEYEKKCIKTIATILNERYPPIWAKLDDIIKDKTTEQEKHDLIQLVKAIYFFNERCKKFYQNVELLTIKDYPDLIYGVSTIFTSDEYIHFQAAISGLLKRNEPELYNDLTKSLDMEDNIADVTSRAALRRLKNNPQNILDNWEKYLEKCREEYSNKYVQCFVRATRWYQTIPIKFAERCIEDLNGNNKQKMPSAFIILGLLLHGDTLTKMIKSIVSNVVMDDSKPDAREDYMIMEAISRCIRFSNPPVSFDITAKLSGEDYESTIVTALINVSRRSSLLKVKLFVEQLISMRVSVRKHGIRLLHMISSMQDYINHLERFWTTETNLSMRKIVFEAAEKFFFKNPCTETWDMYRKIISTTTIEDSNMLYLKMHLNFKLQRQLLTIAHDGITQHIILWFSVIERFSRAKIADEQLNNFLSKFVTMIATEAIFKYVPDYIADEVITRYFFHCEKIISTASRNFALLYIFTKNQYQLLARKETFIDTIKNNILKWNNPHPSKLYFYPVNNTIHNFIIEFTSKCVYSRYQQSFNPQIVDDMLMIFKSHLLPVQDAKSYLLLEYTKLLLECMSANCEDTFGLKLGTRVPYLVEIFTPLLVSFMAKTLREFLSCAYTLNTNDEKTLKTIKLKIMEGLVESQNIPSIVIAVILLSFESRNAKYDNIIKKFMNTHHPAVTTILQHYLNNGEYKFMYFDEY